jgi:DNA-binding NarL/FixJ family response regulator
MSEGRLRCLVVDDHPALVVAVTDFLADKGFTIVETAADGESALAVAEREQPDVALVDYRVPRLAGAELLKRLAEVAPATRAAVYTADADPALVSEAFAAGAAAVVLKEAPLADLVRALETIAAGGSYVDPALASLALTEGGGAPASLTPRELDVLRLLAEGLSHEEIGGRLEISSETVRTHVRKACARLGAATRTQAVAKALRLGLMS